MTPAAGAPVPPGGSPPLLEARDLVRRYGALLAVDGVSLALPAGRVLTVFGPNGAGKSTLLRLLGGGLRPDRGTVLIGGRPLGRGGHESRARIGVLSHQSFLYGQLTARENLRFYGRLYDLDDLDERVDVRLDAVGLLDRGHDRVETFSRGMRQRLALARTLLHDPDVVLLDEPYTGLDPRAAAVLRGVLEALRDGRRAVVLVTHNLLQGLELADRAAIQVRGRFAWEGDAGAVSSHEFEGLYHETVDRAERVRRDPVPTTAALAGSGPA